MKVFFAVLFSVCLLGGCTASRQDVLGTEHSQVETRSYQSRTFKTNDKQTVLKGVISTMQDLGFIVDRADETLGLVSGTSFVNNSKLTVSVRKSGKKQMLDRASAQSKYKEITEPTAYQNFFDALSQSLFLEAHAVE